MMVSVARSGRRRRERRPWLKADEENALAFLQRQDFTEHGNAGVRRLTAKTGAPEHADALETARHNVLEHRRAVATPDVRQPQLDLRVRIARDADLAPVHDKIVEPLNA